MTVNVKWLCEVFIAGAIGSVLAILWMVPPSVPCAPCAAQAPAKHTPNLDGCIVLPIDSLRACDIDEACSKWAGDKFFTVCPVRRDRDAGVKP